MKHSYTYGVHLKRVSRSFAFCIEQLQPPHKEWMGLAYILCRILDTIEDALWADPSQQKEAFHQFNHFISADPNPQEVRQWLRTFPTTIPKGEALLLEKADLFFEDLHSLPLPLKKHFQNSILTMSQGMEHFCTHKQHNNELHFQSMAEVNQYCFFVAGVVGELLTNVFTFVEPDYEVTPEVILNAFHFGLYLQKVNILKDQLGDESEGRHFIHSREEIRKSLATNVRGAFRYLTSLPLLQKNYRIFCGWSLFLGLASLPWIDRSWKVKKLVKISRLETAALLSKVKSVINDNEALENLFKEYIDQCALKIGMETKTQESKSVQQPWFQDLYTGKLSPLDMKTLAITE